MKVLITGGLGYIGSHIANELASENIEYVIIDNLSNSYAQTKTNLEILTGRPVKYYNFDINESEKLEKVLKSEKIDTVIHCAGLKAVHESVKQPERYYESIVETTGNLLNSMLNVGVKNIVFSSSATVYGTQDKSAIDETCTPAPLSPYAEYKLKAEKMIEKAHRKYGMNAIVFRYFNVVGAHPSSLIGDNGKSAFYNVFKYIMNAANQNRVFTIAGGDRPTYDGTAVRDYIHVCDLSKAHVNAVKYLQSKKGFEIINVGTGRQTSILELVKVYNSLTKPKLEYNFTDKRPGDADIVYCDNTKLKSLLNFTPSYTISDVMKTCIDYEKCKSQNLGKEKD